jgi:hypothetical protein
MQLDGNPKFGFGLLYLVAMEENITNYARIVGWRPVEDVLCSHQCTVGGTR